MKTKIQDSIDLISVLIVISVFLIIFITSTSCKNMDIYREQELASEQIAETEISEDVEDEESGQVEKEEIDTEEPQNHKN